MDHLPKLDACGKCGGKPKIVHNELGYNVACGRCDERHHIWNHNRQYIYESWNDAQKFWRSMES